MFTGAAFAAEYTINYEMNGGTNYVGAPTSYFSDDVNATIIDGTPTKANAGFVGWCTDSTLQDCDLTQTIPVGSTENKTFYAKWLVCTDANFFDSTIRDCVACPAYYDYNTTDGKTDVHQCQIQCPAGKFVEIPGVYGYTQLEYLESDGTQYIDTGFVHHSTNIRGELRVGSSSNLNKNVNIIGNQTADGGYSVGWDQAFKIWVESSGDRVQGPAKAMSAGAVYDITYTLTGDSRTISYEGETNSLEHAGGIVTDKHIHLFDNGMHQTVQYFNGRIYYIKLYEDNVLVHEFVPVQRTGGAVGMYDTVTHTFFENSALSGPSVSVTDPCVEAGVGHYAVQEPVNFGSTGTRNACPAGTASNNPLASGLAACVACQGATYNGTTGATACIPCPTGYNYNTTPGKTSIGQCEISCGPGTYVPQALGNGYTEIEYIQTTGIQYINTGAQVAQLVDPIASMTLSYVATEKGKQNGAQKNNIQFKWGISNGGQFLCQAAGNNTEVTFGAADTNKHTFTLNVQNATCTMDSTSHNLTIGNLSAITENIALGNLAGATNRLGKIKIYSFDLSSNNEVIRHMIPARKNDTGTLGMLDTINNVFYTNAGSGTFTAGDDVNVPQCVDVGLGYWSAGGVANYGGTSSRTPCDDGKTTMVTDASSASQCFSTVSVHNVTYSCGDGTGTPPAATTAMNATQFTPAANPCSRANYIFTGWGISGTNDVKDAEVSFIWEYDEDKTLTAQWDTCPACNPTNASCTYTGITNNVCTYTTACDTGYGNIQNDGAYNPICSLLPCTGATYMNNNVCTACPTGYDYDTDDGKTAITQCKTNCPAGSYIATANDASCTDAGAGYWAPGGVVNYGSTSTHTQCTTGLTTVGYGHGANEVGDCGRKLHIGNYVLYSKTTKPSEPAINIQPVGGNTVFYVGASDSDQTLTTLHVTQGNTQYTMYDDSILHGERDFETNTRIQQ